MLSLLFRYQSVLFIPLISFSFQRGLLGKAEKGRGDEPHPYLFYSFTHLLSISSSQRSRDQWISLSHSFIHLVAKQWQHAHIHTKNSERGASESKAGWKTTLARHGRKDNEKTLLSVDQHQYECPIQDDCAVNRQLHSRAVPRGPMVAAEGFQSSA